MTSQYQQINANMKGANSIGPSYDFSVNEASVASGYSDGSIVLQTSEQVNSAGSFTGVGVGNKSIFGVFGYNNLPISQLSSLEFVWENIVGPAGVNFIPPGGTTTVTPDINILVDFDPNGAGDIRILIAATDQLDAAINNSVGTFSNNGSNVLTYSWSAATDNVLIVLSPPNPVPGGVPVGVTTGPSWFQNSYSWAALVAANQNAVIVDAYPGDNGMPAGMILPGIILKSGDDATVIKSGKKIASFKVNGSPVL